MLDVPEEWASAEDSFDHAKPAHSAHEPRVSTKLPVETPYVKLLDQVFGPRLHIANAVNAASVWTPSASDPASSNPEFGYGLLLAQIQRRDRLVDLVRNTLADDTVHTPPDLHRALTQWLLAAKPADGSRPAHKKVAVAAGEAATLLEKHHAIHPRLAEIHTAVDLLQPRSNWLLGSDTWSYDLGQSGLHHVITSGEDVNLLIVDTTPYSRGEVDRERRKKDIGLYAMNFGSVYVASVALYSSFTGVLNVLMEADAFQGPSVVLAYLPQPFENPTAIDVLTETKIAVDSGAWPLYRWNPALEHAGREPFCLDSERIKRDLEEFLERENHLSLLVAQQPDLSRTVVSSLERDVRGRHEELKRRAREDYARLLSGLSGEATGPPLAVLFGSDNGNAEGVAKKLAARAKARGLKTKLMALDDYPDVQDLASEGNVVIVCCTAGQGEFPSNAREFWRALNALSAADLNLTDTRFAVFGLGDSHYWPRPEDAHYYNKPAKLIDAKLNALAAGKLTQLGLGDDQDADGFETGLQAWTPELWLALGVADVVAEAEPPKFSDENNKLVSNFLRGTIAQELLDESTGGMKESDTKILKHHGSYMQDDRDLREERRKMGVEKAFSFMIRVRCPGGVATPKQWLAMDELVDQYAGAALKLTTRQAFQFHGVLKRNLKTTIRGINKALLSTLAACGDVNRNIMLNPNPHLSKIHKVVYDFSIRLMDHLAPRTSAYHEIWLDDKQVAGNAVQDFEPLYGLTYLPRKFKVVIAVPPNNDVDVYAHDLGYIAITEGDELVGYNVTVGGGMGMTHNNAKTYPRTADVIGFCTPDQAVDIAEKVMLVQRDFGDRTNRKHARLKYTIDDRGIEWFKAEVESHLGYKLQETRPFHFTDNADRYGWTKGIDDRWHFGMFIENGKVKDWPDFPVKTGLRELARWHRGDFRLTPNQHLVIANVPEEDLERTKAHLAQYKMDNLNFTGLRLNAMACVALPTCGLAMAESERYLPSLVTKLERAVEEAGLRDDAITIRMTGCPNGCARPYLAEIAFVGKAPGAYNLYLGGGHKGERLNKLYKESVKEAEILAELEPIIKRYAKERNDGEVFGDWVIRAGYVKATTAGKNFHEQ
ncbi:sulphite reductase hemo protein, beta subunit [Jimgerdemannia flammicorona]|uniref:assimilatory sulfite reductase (NADPH) n=1 Tax=Jimgerdemannia flammicorona TaxID=994334 RepID=A0A433D4H9_9FUNG|nr:sulphite reductase hemo protein, beta subunit [Jimgerdemannia flammicorona]